MKNKDIAASVQASNYTQKMSVAPLSALERTQVEKTFVEAKDFRQLGEKITAPIDNIISQTAKVIDADPIMNISDTLVAANNEVQVVYRDIIDSDGAFTKAIKRLPIIGSLARSLDKKWDETSFNLKGIEGKIATIFSGFDQSYTSLNTSIDVQKKFLEGMDDNLSKVVAYKEFLDIKIEEFKGKSFESADEAEKMKYDIFINQVEYFQSNLAVLIGNLDMARKRLMMRLDSASKLSIAMSSSRPIFKTLLSTALIETSSQKAIDASLSAINIMGATIDKMSTELTDKAIIASRKSEELSSKPVLSASVFVENVSKLKAHFDTIEAYREQMRLEAEAHKKLFANATQNLREMKVLGAAEQEELSKELLGTNTTSPKNLLN